MLLSKEIVVYLNLAGCRVKQFTSNLLRKNNVDLTPEQFLTLDILWNQGAMSQTALSEEMQKDKNSITQLVDALERKGFVSRQRDRKDRRSNTVVLTEKAEMMKEETKQFGVSMLDELLKGLEEEELRSFLATLKKITDVMK
ncbi:MAG: MarR family transcriptional regulator [Bacteroidales bacterium]|nr:MarR family transcriptional regulator [Candidatus Cacconaster caballi]